MESMIKSDLVRLPSVTSTNLPDSLASSFSFRAGEEPVLITAMIRLAITVFPNPTLISCIEIRSPDQVDKRVKNLLTETAQHEPLAFTPQPEKYYSIFCICSRIFSSSLLSSTVRWAMVASLILEAMVLTSRRNSWRRKSILRPVASSESRKERN